MPITTTNRKALNIVSGWGGGGTADAKAELLASADVPQQRPNRLGLGASATIKPAERGGGGGDSGFDRAGAKLQAVVKKQQRKEQRDQADRRAEPARGDGNTAESNGESDDDDAGRSGAFQKRSKLATAPPLVAKPAGATVAKRKRGESTAVARPASAVAKSAERASAPRVAEGARAQPAASAGGDAHAAGETGEAVQKPRRTKTRSKQKNLRRDTRADHLKPTYRTPGASDYLPPAPPAWRVIRPPGTAGDDGDAEQ
jgi:hypothetical protein